MALNNQDDLQNNLFGASDTNLNNLSGFGALAKTLGQQLYSKPEENPKDKWLYALQFFTNMAAASSQPGATAIGAAGEAGAETIKTLLEERKQERAEELAATQMGATLLGSLATKGKSIRTVKGDNVTYMSEDDAQRIYPESVYGESFWQNFVPYKIEDGDKVFDSSQVGEVAVNNAGQTLQIQSIYRGGQLSPEETTIIPGPKVSSVDTGDFQDQLTWRTQKDAENYLDGKGFTKETPGYDYIISRMVPKEGDEYLIGKPIVSGDTFTGISFVSKGNEIIGANIGPLRGAAEPRIAIWAKSALERLDDNDNYIESTFNTEERVNAGLRLLLNEKTLTGPWEEFTLGFRKVLANAFSFASKEERELINAQELINSLSFTLAPKMRPVGSGSTSDMEFKAYQKAIADLGNTPLANYLTLYTFKKVSENSRLASQRSKSVILSGGSSDDVENELKKMDAGIYTRIERAEGESDTDWLNRKIGLLKNLKRGEVVYNYDSQTGEKLYETDSNGKEMPDFIVSNGDGSYINFLDR